jgi:hypothetical protein
MQSAVGSAPGDGQVQGASFEQIALAMACALSVSSARQLM